MRISSNGNVGIGTTTPNAPLDVVSTGSVAPNIFLTGYTTTSFSPGFVFRASRGSKTSPTAIQTNDYLGYFGFRGYNGSVFTTVSSGFIGVLAAESWSPGVNGAYMVFNTTPNGNATSVEAIRILGNGNVGIGITVPSAKLHLPISTTSASTAPIKLTTASSNLMTVAEAGAIETEGTRLFFTNNSAARRTLATLEDANTFTSNITVNGVFADTVTTNRQTASYALVLSDRGKLIESNVATANNITVPLNATVAFPIGSKIDVVQYGAGQVSFVATGGVTIRSTNSWLKINSQYGAATLIKIGTDEWYLIGNLNA